MHWLSDIDVCSFHRYWSTIARDVPFAGLMVCISRSLSDFSFCYMILLYWCILIWLHYRAHKLFLMYLEFFYLYDHSKILASHDFSLTTCAIAFSFILFPSLVASPALTCTSCSGFVCLVQFPVYYPSNDILENFRG